MYKVLADFKDLRDGGYEYHAGDTFPREGSSVSVERIAMLSAPTLQRGALIGEVEDEVKVSAPVIEMVSPVTVIDGDIVEQEQEKPKKKKKAKE